MSPRCNWLTWVSAVAVVSACAVPDPLYCDEDTPCTDPERPYCDLKGEFPASEGIGRTCIPNPFPDAGPEDDGGQGQESSTAYALYTVPTGESSSSLYFLEIINGVPGSSTLVSDEFSAVSRAAFTNDGRTAIIQALGQGEDWQVYVLRIDEGVPSAPLPIGGTGEEGEFFVKPDGSGLVFGVGIGLDLFAQYNYVDLTGTSPGEPIPLGGGEFVSRGVMSASGSRFAFHENGAAYVVDLTAQTPSAALRASPEPVSDGNILSTLVLAPDGSRLAYVGDLAANGVDELWVVAITGDGPGAAERASGPMVTGGDVAHRSTLSPLHAFSPDGRKLVYIADQESDGVPELYIVDVGGTGPGTPLKVNGAFAPDGEFRTNGIEPDYAFTPDSKALVYMADQRSDEVEELFVVDISGPAPAPPQRVSGALAAGGDVTTFAISGAGNGMAYTADQRADGVTELFFVDLSGANPSAPRVVNQALPSGGDVVTAVPSTFSSDGLLLAYAADANSDQHFELFVSSVESGQPAPSVSVQPMDGPTRAVHQAAFASPTSMLFVGRQDSSSGNLWFARLADESIQAERVNPVAPTENGLIRAWVWP